MKRIFLTGCLALALWPAVRAQAPGSPEALSAWPYFKELRVPPAFAGRFDFVLDRDILDRARAGQADLQPRPLERRPQLVAWTASEVHGHQGPFMTVHLKQRRAVVFGHGDEAQCLQRLARGVQTFAAAIDAGMIVGQA